jgi:hypothetical protein
MSKMTEQQKIETLQAYLTAKEAMESFKKQVDSLKEVIVAEMKSSKSEEFQAGGFTAKLSTYDRESVSLENLKTELSPTIFKNHIQGLITVSEVQKLSVKMNMVTIKIGKAA